MGNYIGEVEWFCENELWFCNWVVDWDVEIEGEDGGDWVNG